MRLGTVLSQSNYRWWGVLSLRSSCTSTNENPSIISYVHPLKEVDGTSRTPAVFRSISSRCVHSAPVGSCTISTSTLQQRWDNISAQHRVRFYHVTSAREPCSHKSGQIWDNWIMDAVVVNLEIRPEIGGWGINTVQKATICFPCPLKRVWENEWLSVYPRNFWWNVWPFTKEKIRSSAKAVPSDVSRDAIFVWYMSRQLKHSLDTETTSDLKDRDEER